MKTLQQGGNIMDMFDLWKTPYNYLFTDSEDLEKARGDLMTEMMICEKDAQCGMQNADTGKRYVTALKSLMLVLTRIQSGLFGTEELDREMRDWMDTLKVIYDSHLEKEKKDGCGEPLMFMEEKLSGNAEKDASVKAGSYTDYIGKQFMGPGSGKNVKTIRMAADEWEKKSKELSARYGTVYYNFITRDGKEYVTASFDEGDEKQ